MTALGFTLRETRDLLDSISDAVPKKCSLYQSLGFKIEAIEAQLNKLTALRENLLRTQALCGPDCLVQDGKPGCA